MDKQRIDPIVAERDDMIGRTVSSSKSDSSEDRSASVTASRGISGAWKLLIMAAFFGLIALASFGWQQYQSFLILQERFQILDSRLNNTDESVTQSGAAMQVSIGKHGEQLKKHWSEIRKLWGVSNDRNKASIDKNKKDLAFLASKRIELQASIKELRGSIDKDRKKMETVGENYFGLSADIDKVNESLDNYLVALNKLRDSLQNQQKQLQSNAEAIKSIDAFRRQINKKVLNLEQQIAEKAIQKQAPAIEQQVIEKPLTE
jgi:chromosome segregation ATPase